MGNSAESVKGVSFVLWLRLLEAIQRLTVIGGNHQWLMTHLYLCGDGQGLSDGAFLPPAKWWSNCTLWCRPTQAAGRDWWKRQVFFFFSFKDVPTDYVKLLFKLFLAVSVTIHCRLVGSQTLLQLWLCVVLQEIMFWKILSPSACQSLCWNWTLMRQRWVRLKSVHVRPKSRLMSQACWVVWK